MSRKYNSTLRQEKAQATRLKILEAAKTLFSSTGIKKTTIDQIAKKANVATPTVYAQFGSKAGIINQLGQTLVFGDKYKTLVQKSFSQEDARESLKLAPVITVTIFELEMAQMGFIWHDPSAASELADLIAQLENQRYDRQQFIVERLDKQQRLPQGLSQTAARDILWALTGRELFRKLVLEKGWTHSGYIAWLEGTLVSTLIRP